MKGFIYLTKEFNSDGQELKHDGLTKIGIGKTNNLDRRFQEHHNKGSKSTTEVNFIEHLEVKDMDFVEKQLHKILKSLGFIVVPRTSVFDSQKIESKTEVFSGKHIDTGEEISEKLILQIYQSIVTGEEFLKVALKEFKPHLLQEVIILQILDAIRNGGECVNLIAELCARFGKTLTYLELFKRLENDIMILPSYVHSVFTSFENEIIGKYKDETIGKWSNFHGYKIIDTRQDELNWQKKFQDNLGKSKMVVFVSCQTGDESFSKFDIIKSVESDRKFIVVDEADYGAYTEKSKKVIDYIV